MLRVYHTNITAVPYRYGSTETEGGGDNERYNQKSIIHSGKIGLFGNAVSLCCNAVNYPSGFTVPPIKREEKNGWPNRSIYYTLPGSTPTNTVAE